MTDTSFESLPLHPLLHKALAARGYDTATPIQAASIEAALARRDVIGLAPTGTGKTLAYSIPLAQQLLEHPPPIRKGRGVDPAHRLRALVLCPVRELAQQVAEEARTLTRGSVLRTKAVYGKSALRPQRDVIEAGVDLLVGTPGRLRELLSCGALSLAHVRHVVVDECDRMLDMGFLPQVRYLLERMPSDRQMMFFSATMPKPIAELATSFLEDPFRAEIGANTVVEHIQQQSMHIPDMLKVPLLLALLTKSKRRGVIVYASTRRRAGWVATALRRNGLRVGLIHGNRSQPQRQRAIEQFSKGEVPILVATDVAARGLHIPVIKTVINYDLPVSEEEYVHRVGRAGHGGGFGESITFVSPRDEERWPNFRRVAGAKIDKIDPPEMTEWLRPVDLERLERLERMAKLRKPPPMISHDFEEESRGHIVGRGDKKKRNKRSRDADATDAPIKFSSRGKSARRSSRARPIARGEKPGRGVKKNRSTK